MKNVFDNFAYFLRIFHATLLHAQLKPMHIMKPIINKRFRFPSAYLQILKLVVQFDDDRVLAVHFIIFQYRLVISKIYLFFMFVFENANQFILRQLNISFLFLFFMFKRLLSFYFFFSLLTQFLSFMFRQFHHFFLSFFHIAYHLSSLYLLSLIDLRFIDQNLLVQVHHQVKIYFVVNLRKFIFEDV